MPELPEVETTLQGIRPYLLQASIVKTSIYNDKLRWPISEQIQQISQAQVLNLKRRAKYLLIQTSQGGILIHLGMSGSLRICPPDLELRKHDHAIFHLSSGQQLRYHDPRRFGCILYSEDICNHPLLAKLGPEPLSAEFSATALINSCQLAKSPIKQHIMNNKNVVGVGNIYACESLFLAKIHPNRAANRISKTRLTTLHSTIQSVLTAAIEKGGTTLRDFVKQDGTPGYFQQSLHTYGREGQLCNLCTTPIKRIIQGQRSTFYCPNCQK